MRMRFIEKVGIVLTINSATPLIHTAFRYGRAGDPVAPFEADEHRHHDQAGPGRRRHAGEEIRAA